MLAVKYLILLIVIGVVTLFSTINMDPVKVNYYNLAFEIEHLEIPLILVSVLSAALGFIIAWFFEIAGIIKSKFKLSKQGREIKKTSHELNDLKVQTAVPKSLQQDNPQ